MSGVAQQLRARRRANPRPHHHTTKARSAEDLREVALYVLELPDLSPEAFARAHRTLERVGDLLDSPRCGWYPRKPAGWRS